MASFRFSLNETHRQRPVRVVGRGVHRSHGIADLGRLPVRLALPQPPPPVQGARPDRLRLAHRGQGTQGSPVAHSEVPPSSCFLVLLCLVCFLLLLLLTLVLLILVWWR